MDFRLIPHSYCFQTTLNPVDIEKYVKAHAVDLFSLYFSAVAKKNICLSNFENAKHA